MKKCDKLVNYFLIILFLTLPCFGQNEERKEEISNKTKFNSLQKSLLIPGWGQIAERRYAEGALFLSAEIFCFYKIFSYNHKGNRYYNFYKKADSIGDAVKFRELTEKYDIRRNRIILAAAGVWVINLIDIYFIVRNKEKRAKNLRLKFEWNEPQELVFTIFFSF